MPLALQTQDAHRILRSGFKHEIQGRNWRRLALKLATPGSNVTVAVFGGSVTVGHYPSCDNSSWVEEAWHWMEAAFPSVHFNFVHLGHGATSANVASLCYYQDLPPEADLVLVEYSLNGVAAYENLLRKVILRAPNTALLSFAAFAWKVDEVGNKPPYTSVPNPFWNTGEDQHAILAKRYGVPMVSVRDALYDIMFNDDVARAKLGMTREEMMHDHVHPQLPAQQVDEDTYCAAGEELSKHKVTNIGWKWVDEGRRTCSHLGCRKYGWTSNNPGSYIDFEFDSSRILTKDQAQNGHRISLVMLFLRSHGNNPSNEQGAKNGMGVALITCVSGCECEPLRVNAVNTDRASELDTIRTTVTAHPHCRVRATILSETSSGGHKFRINGLALAPFNSAVAMGRFDRMLFDKEYLVTVQRFDSTS
ncbi:hypothetical protein COO60DRAFT_1625477 [Scenedesmus sp. NREL 46B-D3]|nr:hypothetical protein COO60DRAFT_1625477 [Scenedesmus sp. NREL 46B-D3]